MKSSRLRIFLYAGVLAAVSLPYAGAANAQSFDLSLYRERPVKNFFAEKILVDSPFEQSAQPSPAPQSTTATTTTQGNANAPQTTASTTKKVPQKTSNDRLFYALPDFLTIPESDSVVPLTWKEKYAVTARGVIDPSEFVLVGFVALIGQGTNDNPTYGQGMQGYAKRYGTAYADNAIENMLASAVFPSILRQDPRYFELGHGGFKRRTIHALSRVIITRSDAGTHQFNFSEVGGALTAAVISTYTYHPQSERGFSNIISVWGTQIGWDMATYMLKEFWPDLRRRTHKTQIDIDEESQTSAAAPTSGVAVSAPKQ